MSLQKQLYAIADYANLPGEELLLSGVAEAIQGGCRLFQYRDKCNPYSLRLSYAQRLKALCHQHHCRLIINDDILLAKTIEADGVHIGQSDSPLPEARAVLGEKALIGVTCHHSIALASEAADNGADYVAFGRFFPSKTKPGATAAPMDILIQAKQQLSLPVVAIGGISVDNAPALLEAGADILAVSHSLFSSRQIKQETQKFDQLFR